MSVTAREAALAANLAKSRSYFAKLLTENKLKVKVSRVHGKAREYPDAHAWGWTGYSGCICGKRLPGGIICLRPVGSRAEAEMSVYDYLRQVGEACSCCRFENSNDPVDHWITLPFAEMEWKCQVRIALGERCHLVDA